eukprot:TRINITY_DN30840_c0_g1_i1.p1 TRINITY_DN30840_c0_g1~~TRINITY_DN30840_c0_g1_i1.p1  ORF type:complete len:603 (+),score=118.89 TRINITY_DN30840_c0_g1_i1:159-1967(+)
MLGSFLAGGLLNPVNKCCYADDAPCFGDAMGGSLSEILEHQPGMSGSSEFLVDGKDIRGLLPKGPPQRLVPTYATTRNVELRGEPLYTGTILQLKLGESIHQAVMSLHVNGFRVDPVDPKIRGFEPRSRAWSPFSLVEKCQVKSMQNSTYWAVFKLTVFRTEESDSFMYFATQGENAAKERDEWVSEIAHAISQVTISLFPPHAITVQPVAQVAQTATRIMAGYLLQSGLSDNVSLIYCELHAYSGGEAKLAVYKDEWCEHEVRSIPLADTSVVSTRKGAYCTVFGIDEHRLCARTREEKELWLRAVSNIKVKLMFEAPDPTNEDLSIFRAAIRERIDLMGQPDIGEDNGLPLLMQVTRMPDISSPRGDILNPEPIDEAAENSPRQDSKPVEVPLPQPGPCFPRQGSGSSQGAPFSAAAAAMLAAAAAEAGAEIPPPRADASGDDSESDSLPVQLRPGPTLQQDGTRQIAKPFAEGKLMQMTATKPSSNPSGGTGSRSMELDAKQSQVREERAGVNPTVHVTGKAIVMAHQALLQRRLQEDSVDAAAAAQDGVGCRAGCMPQHLAGPTKQAVPLASETLTPTPGIPLLAWSPGRRQTTQRAL